jgi:hypothetical protein
MSECQGIDGEIGGRCRSVKTEDCWTSRFAVAKIVRCPPDKPMVELQIGAALRDPAAVRAAVKATTIVVLTATLCTLLGYVSLTASFKHGQLSVPPLYDDVSYFVDAARWLSAAPSRSLAANLYALLDQHAPFTTLTSAIGLSIVPGGYVGPYLVNVVLVAAFMLAVACLTWHLSIVDIATCLIGLACIPMTSVAMTEGRPDLIWGLALGLAVGGIFYQPLFPRSFGSLFFLGLLCGFAAALKPTALPASVAFILFAVCAAVLWECFGSANSNVRLMLKQSGVTLLLFGLGFFLGVAAIVGIGLAETIRYILNTMINNRDFWATPGSLSSHLIFYSVGKAGRMALSYWFLAGLLLFAVRFWLSRHDRSELLRALALLAVVAAAYAIPTASVMKTFWLGAIFYGPFIVAMVLNYVAIVDRLAHDRGGVFGGLAKGLGRNAAALLRLLPLAAIAMLFFGQLAFGDAPLVIKLDQRTISDIRNATERTWSVLSVALPHETSRTLAGHGQAPIVTVASPYPITSATIQLYAVRAHLNMDARAGYFARTEEEAAASLSTSDFAIVTSSMPSNLPVPPMGDELIRRLDADSHMCLVESVALLTVREMRIYRHSETGCGSPVHTEQ